MGGFGRFHLGRRGQASFLGLLLGVMSAAGGAPGRAAAGSASGPAQEAGATVTLSLSAAPVSLVVPADQPDWGRLLAGYAGAAAAASADVLGAPVPSGTLRWQPDPSAAAATDASVSLATDGGAPVITFDDPFALLAEDYGVGFAQGYARWLVDYAVARLYFARAPDPGAWWIDGAALHLTGILARRRGSTVPVLFNLESAFGRAASRAEPVPLDVAPADGSGDARRGKAYLTFRLLEAAYGEAPLAGLLRALASPGGADLRQALARALPAAAAPDPATLLDAWLRPRTALDVGLTEVQVDRSGKRIHGRVSRSGEIGVPTVVEVRLANGQRVRVDIPAGTGSVPWELAIDAAPVEVLVDPDGLLPDVVRSNNSFGFGSAARIESFFPIDDVVEIGELHFDGAVEGVGRKRVEGFEVTLRNLTDRPVGLGLLVSAQWLSRPADRVQRRVFVLLPPNQRVLARDFVEYPRRGNGRVRIEARYWLAPDPEALTARLLRDDADTFNSYMVIRAGEEVLGAADSPLQRLDEQQRIESVAELTIGGPAGAPPLLGEPASAQGARGDAAESEGELKVRIVTPQSNATPLGAMVFSATVEGPPAALLELYVNDRIIGRGEGRAVRAAFEASEEESRYELRALAVSADGRIATDTLLLQRSAIGFGTSVDLVTVNVTVRQPGGGLVEDLGAADFEVIEDGVPQQIESFEKGEDTAVSVAMLIDTSSSMYGGGIASARAGANILVDSLLRGNDRAMVLGFNDRLYLYSDFTNDVPALREAIDATDPDGGTRLYDAITESLRKVDRRSGRRALIVLSDGLDVGSRFAFADVQEYARQSDVLVYTIGLQLMHDATGLGGANDVVRRSVENLRSLAEVTGGSAYFPLRLDELESIYAEIAAELESQYSISYYPTNQRWDGRWRVVQVRLQGRGGRVQARPGYYGVRPGESG